MPRHVRHVLGRLRPGRYVMNYNWPPINAESVVHISASEWAKPEKPLSTGETPPRFVGDARIRVENVSPHSSPNGVTFAVVLELPGDPTPRSVPICLDITVFDEQPEVLDFRDDAKGVLTKG